MQTTTASLNWIIFYNSCLCRWWSQLPFFFTASHSQLKIQTQLLVFQKFHINDHEKSVEIAIDLIMIRLLFAVCIHHIALENRKMEMCNVIRYKRCSSMKNLHSIQRELRKSVFASNFHLLLALSFAMASLALSAPRLRLHLAYVLLPWLHNTFELSDQNNSRMECRKLSSSLDLTSSLFSPSIDPSRSGFSKECWTPLNTMDMMINSALLQQSNSNWLNDDDLLCEMSGVLRCWVIWLSRGEREKSAIVTVRYTFEINLWSSVSNVSIAFASFLISSSHNISSTSSLLLLLLLLFGCC